MGYRIRDSGYVIRDMRQAWCDLFPLGNGGEGDVALGREVGFFSGGIRERGFDLNSHISYPVSA